MRFLPAEVLNTFADRQIARGCDIVTVRQRPETANGVVFVTMEDETGPVNVIVWRDLVDRQRKELLSASLLGVYGTQDVSVPPSIVDQLEQALDAADVTHRVVRHTRSASTSLWTSRALAS